MSRNIETADSIFGIDNLRASDYALISSLVEDLLVHKSSKKSMQLVTSHKVRTVKQPAVNNHVMSFAAEESKEQEAESSIWQC